MYTLNLDNILWVSGMMAEVAIVALLLYKRVGRTLPFFCAYCVWGLLSDVGGFLTFRYFHPFYPKIYFGFAVLDAVLQFCVLVELAWSLFKPIRKFLPRQAPIAVAALILVVCAAIWPETSLHGLVGLTPLLGSLVRAQQTASIARILFFLLLAGLSQVLAISWRDRELQVATGLGFYSLCSISVELLHSHQRDAGSRYHQMDQLVVASYLASLLYWFYCFAQQEVARQDFSPPVERFLLGLARYAHLLRRSMPPETSPDQITGL
jgi:hypothetical protein